MEYCPAYGRDPAESGRVLEYWEDKTIAQCKSSLYNPWR